MRQQGVRGLYNGITITLLEIMPYAAMQFGLYDAFTAAHRKRMRQQVLDGKYCHGFAALLCWNVRRAAEVH